MVEDSHAGANGAGGGFTAGVSTYLQHFVRTGRLGSIPGFV